MAGVQGRERMSHHGVSSAPSASPSCMGHPVTVQQQIRAWREEELIRNYNNYNSPIFYTNS